MDIVDEISRLKVWNLYIIPILRKVIEKMSKRGYQFAYFDYTFATDKRTRVKMVTKSALRKRFLTKSDRGQESFNNCMRNIIIDENTIILVVFHYSQFYTFCPSLYKLNKDNIDEFCKPIIYRYLYKYEKNIWFRDEVLIDMFEQIDTKLIIFQLKEKQKDQILVLERNAARNKLFLNNIDIEMYIEVLGLHLIHKDVIDNIKRAYSKNKNIIIFCNNNYLSCHFLLIEHTSDYKKFNYITD